MALDFPAGPHPEGFQWQAPNNVTYTWRNGYWTGVNDEAGVVLQAPDITSVAMHNQGTGTGRFTSNTFQVDPVIAANGRPASTKSLKVQLEEPQQLRTITNPQTDTITDVQITQFVDGFNIFPVNDNNWYDITWFGPPWNFYFAYATNSVDGPSQARSTDGITWTAVNSGIFPTSNCRPVYVEKYQRVYWVNRGYSVYWTDDPDLQTYTEAINFGGNSPNAEARINQLQYFPEQDFFIAYREYWTAPNIMRSAVGDGDLSSGWRTQGTVQGYCKGGTIVKPGTNEAMVIMNSYGPPNENYQQTVYTTDITASSISWQNPLNGQTAGVSTDIGGYFDTVAERWVMACNYPVQGTVSWDGNSTPTNANATVTNHGWSISRMEWFEELGYAVGVGGNAGASEGYVYIITDGGRQIQEIVTDPVAYNNWNAIMWRQEDPKFLLCGSAGAERFAWSATLGVQTDLPTLTFASNNGLDGFTAGMAVQQDNAAASGTIAGINANANQMTILGTVGAWGPANDGRFVIGPAENFPRAWAVVDGTGNVTGLAPFDPGFVEMTGEPPYDVVFPADIDGTAPDGLIAEGTQIRATMRLQSEAEGFSAEDEATSPFITPT